MLQKKLQKKENAATNLEDFDQEVEDEKEFDKITISEICNQDFDLVSISREFNLIQSKMPEQTVLT